jgi:hypothetical protein
MYKGSSQANVEVFEPQAVVAVDIGKLKQAGVEADKVVWVSERREYALPFAMLFGKVKFSLFFNDEFEKHRLSITSLDYKEKLNLDEKIYLYELEEANYIDVYGPESVCLEPVKVVNYEEYTIREVLRQYDVYVPSKWEIE